MTAGQDAGDGAARAVLARPPGTGDPAPDATPGAPPGVAPGRRYNRWKAGFVALAIVGVIAAAGWALLGSKFLVVRSVEVTGTHVVPASEVLGAAQVPLGLPLLRVNTAAVAHRIERIPQVQSAAVTRDWPDHLVITIQERTPALAVPAGRVFDLVDPAGVVVREVRKPPAGIPQFVPSGALLGNQDVRAAASVMRSLPRAMARRVTSVTVPTPGAVTLHLPGRVTIDWGTSGMTAQKLQVLAILMRSTRAHYFDVSSSGSAVTG